MAKVIYTAEAHVTGGRLAGHGRTTDGALEVDIRIPPEMGGEGGGTNPEQLFAVGFAACFESAMSVVARREKRDADEAKRIVAAAHKVCPYSNATRGNIEVKLMANGEPVD